MPENTHSGGCLPRTHEVIKNYSVDNKKRMAASAAIRFYPGINSYLPHTVRSLPQIILWEGQDRSLRGALR